MRPINIAAAVTAAAIALALTACGKSSKGSESASAPSAEVQMTASELLDKAEASGLCSKPDVRADLGSEVFDNACEKLYGEPAGSFTDGGIMFVGSGAEADEISVLAGKDTDCTELLTQRRDRRYKDFEGYAPDELEKIEQAEIFTVGDLTVLVISDSADEIKELLGG